MLGVVSERLLKNQSRAAIIAVTGLASLFLFFPLSAQQQGPMKPPPGTSAPCQRATTETSAYNTRALPRP